MFIIGLDRIACAWIRNDICIQGHVGEELLTTSSLVCLTSMQMNAKPWPEAYGDPRARHGTFPIYIFCHFQALGFFLNLLQSIEGWIAWLVRLWVCRSPISTCAQKDSPLSTCLLQAFETHVEWLESTHDSWFPFIYFLLLFIVTKLFFYIQTIS